MGTARSGIGWLIAQVGALAMAWLANIYFTRALAEPQTSLGTFYAFETVVAFLVLLGNGGLNEAIIKRISEGTDAEEFATAGVLLSLALVVVLSVGVIIASPLLIDFFELGGLSVLLVLVTLFAYQCRDTMNALLASNFQVGRTGGINFANSIGQVAVQVSLVSIGLGAVALMIGYTVGAILAAAIAVYLISKRFTATRPSEYHFQSLIRFARYSFLNNFVQKFYDNIDIIVITVLIGRAATGIYGIGFRFSLLVMVVYSAISRSVTPEISKQDTEGNQDRIREILSDSIVLGLFFGIPALAGFAVLAQPTIVTFYTAEFESATLVALGAVATRIPEGLRSTASTVLSSMDRPDITFRGGAILITTNLVLDLILVPTIGIVGAVVASFIGMSLQLLYLTYHLFQILNLSYADLPVREVVAEVVASVIMAGVVYGARNAATNMSFLLLTGLVLLGVASYLAIILLISGGVRRRLFGIARVLVP
ncbi:oligosaccharide flippase family protein [Halogeometricum borinquense]|uniref:Oligosaccharide flippase family protein n=1 Tax=Halogeometricum borinquense TaxID=60847 RepID=A0A6C0UFK1_9EURY|nr:oligosaccharide flippase family protein [Halogeometricum borinquense]QIB74232.1 oligosaccharide flippase family protein [Halogeometricum borinquense]